jgi:hypothetical protein
MFNNIQFYHGTQQEYLSIPSDILDDCFYYTYDSAVTEEGIVVSTSGIVRLYLRDRLIFCSNMTEVLDQSFDKLFEEKLQPYILSSTKTNEEEDEIEQEIFSPLKISNDLIITKNLTMDGNINAKNFIYQQLEENNDIVTIPCNLIVDGNTVNLKILNTNSINVANTAITETLSFGDSASISNIPSYNGFNFKEGSLNIKNINANSITINGSSVLTEQDVNTVGTVMDDLTINGSIRIGNLILSDDNGNLKITSV